MDFKYFLPFIVVALLQSSTGNWTEGSIIGVVVDSPASNQIISINLPGTDPAQDIPFVWHTVDVSGLVPPDTKAVHLNFMYASTPGQTPNEYCWLMVRLRKTGTNPVKTEVSKMVAGGISQRDNYTDWVTVDNGRFDFMWEKYPDEAGDYPEHCAIGFAVKLSAYLR